MNIQPAVSVVMAVYNAENYLEQSIESIIDQTLNDWELLIVDDGSTDNSLRIAENYSCRDNRIKIICNSKNIGLAASLNKVIEAAKGKYIARMDADDIALKNRLKYQVNFLENNPDYILVGSNAIYINDAGQLFGHTNLSLVDEEIRVRCLFENPFVHPTILMRSALFHKHDLRYDSSFETTQDWAFWITCLPYGRVANLQESTIKQRIHTDSISSKKRSRQLENSLRVQEKYVQTLIGHENWDKSLFNELNVVFLGERLIADRSGADRIATCHKALDLLQIIRSQTDKSVAKYAERFVVQRACLMGLGLPIRNGYLRLFLRLLIKYPLGLVSSISEIICAKICRKH